TTLAGTLEQRKLPVLWLEGRSGDGKSVLLLQLAAEILAGQHDTLLYQATRPDTLPDLIDHLRNAYSPSEPALVVVEDAHKVSDPVGLAATLKVQMDQAVSPLGILACGPTPEREAFERKQPSISVSHWSIP